MKQKIFTVLALIIFLTGINLGQDYKYVADIDTAVNGPHGVAVDPEGKIWYAAHGDSVGVRVLNSDLTPASFSPITKVSIEGTEHDLVTSFKGIEVDQNGDIVLVINSVELYRINYKDGTGKNFLNLKTLPGNGDSISSFSKPGIDAAGNIYLAAVVPVSNAIWKLNKDFQFVSNIIDVQDPQWWSRAVAASPDGKDVYIATLWASPRVIHFHSDDGATYEMKNELPEPEFGFGGQVSALEFDREGKLWISDEGPDNRGFWIYDFSSASYTLFNGENESVMTNPRGVAFSLTSDTLFVANFGSHKIQMWAKETPQTLLVDDFEDADTINNMSGSWQITGGLAGNLTFEIANEGYNSNHSIHITGQYANWAGIEAVLSTDASPVDVSKYKGIRFAVKASVVDTLRIRAREQKRVDDGTYEFAKYDFFPTSDWTLVEVPFSEFVSSYTSGPLTPAFDATDLTAIDFASFRTSTNCDFYIDDIEFISQITGIEKQDYTVPSEYDLSQNYPNPFNPSTTIEFKLSNSGFAVLKVYDMLGNEVTTLVNEELSAGSYKTNFDASNLSSGVYFYALKINNKTFSQKMLLMK